MMNINTQRLHRDLCQCVLLAYKGFGKLRATVSAFYGLLKSGIRQTDPL